MPVFCSTCRIAFRVERSAVCSWCRSHETRGLDRGSVYSMLWCTEWRTMSERCTDETGPFRCGRVQTFTRQREAKTIQRSQRFACSRNVLGYSRHYRTSEGTPRELLVHRTTTAPLPPAPALRRARRPGPPRMPVLSCCCCCCSEHSHKPNERHDAPSSSSSHTIHVSVATPLLDPFIDIESRRGWIQSSPIISHHLPSSPIISHGFNHLPSSGRAVPPAPRKSAMKSPSDSPRATPPSHPTVGGRVLMLGA